MKRSGFSLDGMVRIVMMAVLICGPALSAAAAARVTAQVRPAVLTVGDTTEYTVTVRGIRNPNPPTPPRTQAFRISPPRRVSSSQMNMVNGKTSVDQSIVFSFSMLAQQPGDYVIGPYPYDTGRGKVQVPAVRIRVAKGHSSTADGAELKPLFTRLVTERSAYYVQEVFDLTVKVYAVEEISLGRNIQLLDLDATGLDLQQFEELSQTREVVDGQIYNVRAFRTKARGLTAGTFTLAPTLRIPVIVQSQRRNRFDPFAGFFGRQDVQQYDVPTEKLDLRIMPLPEADKPATFSGAVGHFFFDVDVQPRKVRVGDPVTVTMTISGAGNIEAVTAPSVQGNTLFKVYEPRMTSNDIQAERGTGRKIFEQAVLPKNMEAKEIPALSFSYFDPAAGRYNIITRGPFPLTLEASSNRVAHVLRANPDQQPDRHTKILGADIIYLKPAPRQWRKRSLTPWYARPSCLLIQIAPLLGLLGLYGAMRRRRNLEKDIARARRGKAPRSARAGLASARKACARRDTHAFIEAVWQTLSDYFGHRLNLAPGEISARRICELLDGGRLDETTRRELTTLFELCEGARYGEASPRDENTMRETIHQLDHVIRTCEKVKQ